LRFGGQAIPARQDRRHLAVRIAPYLRGRISAQKRYIANFADSPDVLEFVNSAHARELAFLGTSCPDHFIRTKIRPLFIPWAADEGLEALRQQIDRSLAEYRIQYRAYYRAFATPTSPAMRDASPAVVLIPGLGMFSFGKNKTEARITGEFYTNAIHVIDGASRLAEGEVTGPVPQCPPGADPTSFKVVDNYVALPSLEAFRIEYWALEDAKLRRQPPEKELSRRVALIVGGASGIGREVARLAAARGAHVVVADLDAEGASRVAAELGALSSPEWNIGVSVDIRSREAIRAAIDAASGAFGGVDILVSTAAHFPASPDGIATDSEWTITFDMNVKANYLLATEIATVFEDQGLHGNIVFTSSPNAVVARGTEAYDVSKAALSHLVRELAISLAPNVRVNAISPATVVRGSAMFPRERLRAALTRHGIPFRESFSDEELRSRLATYYAERSLTLKTVDPADCAEMILFLASSRARCTTGHIVPIDGGLTDAFLR